MPDTCVCCCCCCCWAQVEERGGFIWLFWGIACSKGCILKLSVLLLLLLLVTSG
jgi:hypothetical protein